MKPKRPPSRDADSADWTDKSDARERARHRVLVRAPADVPLARDGVPLRRALREAASEGARHELVRAWIAALDTLHAAGFGTEDAVASALVAPQTLARASRGPVCFTPHAVWPLGTLTAKRPVVAFRDREEAHAWLVSAGADARSLALAAVPEPPWDGFPGTPRAARGVLGGLIAVVGPPAEVASLAGLARLAAVPPSALTPRAWTSSARLRLVAALAEGTPILVPLATPQDLARLPLVPAAVVGARSVGAAPALDADTALALGIDPELVADLDESSAGPGREHAHRVGEARPPTADLQRALEAARMEDDPERRAQAEAHALAMALDEAVLAPEDADLRLSAIIDRAREGRDRELIVATLVRRALSRFDAPRLMAQDLLEARRLATILERADEVACLGALLALASAVHPGLEAQLPPRMRESEQSAKDTSNNGTRRMNERLTGFAREADEGRWLDLAPEALTLAGAVGAGPGSVEARLGLGLVLERLGSAVVATAREEEGERLVRRFLATAQSPQLVPLGEAWAALFAARREAFATARERMMALFPRLERAPHALGRAAAGKVALAARRAGMDGLVAAALALAEAGRPREPAGRKGHDELGAGRAQASTGAVEARREGPTEAIARLVDHQLGQLVGVALELPTWLVIHVLEAVAVAPDADLRRALAAVAGLVARRPELARAQGFSLVHAALALGTDPGLARELALPATVGERHAERRALEILMRSGDQAAAERLFTLKQGSLAEVELPPPPLTPEAGAERVLSLLGRVVAGASRPAGPAGVADRWRAAVSALIGPPAAHAALPTARSAAFGLALIQLEPDLFRLEAGDGAMVELTAHERLDQPELVARLLASLAPLLGARTEQRDLGGDEGESDDPLRAGGRPRLGRPTPDGLEAALQAGELTFFPALVEAFKDRELTRQSMRLLLHHGLVQTRGLYQALAERWRIEDYKRFMDFLRRNDLLLDYRPYRRGVPPHPEPRD